MCIRDREKAAYEEADHASRFAEMLGEVVTDSTKTVSYTHLDVYKRQQYYPAQALSTFF